MVTCSGLWLLTLLEPSVHHPQQSRDYLRVVLVLIAQGVLRPPLAHHLVDSVFLYRLEGQGCYRRDLRWHEVTNISALHLYYNIVIIKGMITSTQKIIKIGSSGGVTIPAKEMKRQGITIGDMVQVTISKIGETNHLKLMKDLDDFMETYGESLKNLADR